MKHLEEQINNLPEVNDITDLFNLELPDIYPKENREKFLLDQELNKKMYSILNKYKNEEVEIEKERRHKERFNF